MSRIHAHQNRKLARLILGVALGVSLLAVTSATASRGTSQQAIYNPCDTIWIDWVYESPAGQAGEYADCLRWGLDSWDPPYGSWDWIDAHSA
jgi:hypothetical protein